MLSSHILLFPLLLSISFEFFEPGTPVLLLDASNFDKTVVQSSENWMVLFFAPWCGHCKHFSPEYEKAAKNLKGLYNIAAVNADAEKELGRRYNITGYPSVLYFGKNKTKPEKYTGRRTVKALAEYLLSKTKEDIESRIGVKLDSPTSSTNQKAQAKPNPNSQQNTKKNTQNTQNTQKSSTEDNVVVLTDASFNEIFSSQDMWMVAFYAPWCGHCKKLLPEWTEAATKLKGQIKIAKIDATVNTQMAGKYQIQGYPTIKVFAPGKEKTVEEYNGPRDSAGIVEWALNRLERFGFVPDVPQLLGQSTINDVCMDKIGICVIAFLPNIADSSKEERNRYLSALKNASKSVRGKPLYFIWAQGGDNADFEDKLHLGFGYPAVVAIHYKKKLFATCRSSFNEENLKEFYHNLLAGKEHLSKLPDGIKVKNVEKWDGKDYVKKEEKEEL